MKFGIERVRSAVERDSDRLLQLKWEEPLVYWSWLSQTHHFVKWTTRLICLAAGRAPLDSHGAAFHATLVEHLSEEGGHDLIAAEDLTRLRAKFRSDLDRTEQEEWPETRALHQSLFHSLLTVTDAAASHLILGRMLYFEGLACIAGPKLYSRLEKSYGTECTEFLRLHALADQDHFAHDLQALDDLTAVGREKVSEEFLRSQRHYDELLKRWTQIERTLNRVSA